MSYVVGFRLTIKFDLSLRFKHVWKKSTKQDALKDETNLEGKNVFNTQKESRKQVLKIWLIKFQHTVRIGKRMLWRNITTNPEEFSGFINLSRKFLKNIININKIFVHVLFVNFKHILYRIRKEQFYLPI